MPEGLSGPRRRRGSYLLLAPLAALAAGTFFHHARGGRLPGIISNQGFDGAAEASVAPMRSSPFRPAGDGSVPLLDAPSAQIVSPSAARSGPWASPGADREETGARETSSGSIGEPSLAGAGEAATTSAASAGRREPVAADLGGRAPTLRAELRETLGDRGVEEVKRAASEPWLLPALIDRLADHPRLLGALANNGLLIGAFMASPPVRRVCEDRGAMEDFLSDGQSESGVAPLQRLLERTSRKPAAARALFESQGASTFLSRCTSILAIRMDPAPAARVIDRNPRVLDSLELFEQGLGVNPDSKQFAQELRNLDDYIRRNAGR